MHQNSEANSQRKPTRSRKSWKATHTPPQDRQPDRTAGESGGRHGLHILAELRRNIRRRWRRNQQTRTASDPEGNTGGNDPPHDRRRGSGTQRTGGPDLRNGKARRADRVRNALLRRSDWWTVCAALHGSREDYDEHEQRYLKRTFKLHGSALQSLAKIYRAKQRTGITTPARSHRKADGGLFCAPEEIRTHSGESRRRSTHEHTGGIKRDKKGIKGDKPPCYSV